MATLPPEKTQCNVSVYPAVAIMPTVKEFEDKIRRVEGVKVCLKNEEGRDMRDDKRIFQSYDVESRISGDATVSDLVERVKIIIGTNVKVSVIKNGKEVHGNSKIKSIRE